MGWRVVQWEEVYHCECWVQADDSVSDDEVLEFAKNECIPSTTFLEYNDWNTVEKVSDRFVPSRYAFTMEEG